MSETILNRIFCKIENEVNIDVKQAKYIIIHPETERKIFIEGELEKSKSLEEEMGLSVILSKQVKIDEIIIGI